MKKKLNFDISSLNCIKFHLEQNDYNNIKLIVEKIVKFKKLKSMIEDEFYVFLSKIIYMLNNYSLIYIKKKEYIFSKKLILLSFYLIKNKEYLYLYKLELSTLNIYIWYYKKLKKYNKCKNLWDKCLDIANFKKDNENLIIIYNNYTSIYLKLKNYNRAYDCSKHSINLCIDLINWYNTENDEVYEKLNETLKIYILALINKAKIEKFLKKNIKYKNTLEIIEGISITYKLETMFKQKIDNLKNDKYISYLNKKLNKKNKNNMTTMDFKNYNISRFYEKSYEFKTKLKKKVFSQFKIKNNTKFILNKKYDKLTKNYIKNHDENDYKINILNKLNNTNNIFFNKKKNNRSIRLSINYFNKLNFNNTLIEKSAFNLFNNRKIFKHGDIKNYVIKIQSHIRRFLNKNIISLKSFKFNKFNKYGKKIFYINNKKIIFNTILSLKDYNAIEVKLYKNFNLYFERLFLNKEIFNINTVKFINNYRVSLSYYNQNLMGIFAKTFKSLKIIFLNSYEISVNVNKVKRNNIDNLKQLNTSLSNSSLDLSIENLIYQYDKNKFEKKFNIKNKVLSAIIFIQKCYRSIKQKNKYENYINFNPILIDFGNIKTKKYKFYFFIIFRKSYKNYFLFIYDYNCDFLQGLLVKRINYSLNKIIFSLYYDNNKFIYRDFLFKKKDEFIIPNTIEKNTMKNIIKNKENILMKYNKSYMLNYDLNEYNDNKVIFKLIGKKSWNNYFILFNYNKFHRFLDLKMYKNGFNTLYYQLFYYIPFKFKNVKLLIKNFFLDSKIEKINKSKRISFNKNLIIFKLNIYQKRINRKIIYLQKNFWGKKIIWNSKVFISRDNFINVKILYLNLKNILIIKFFNSFSLVLIKEIKYNFGVSQFNKKYLNGVFFMFLKNKFNNVYIKDKKNNLKKYFKIKNKLKFVNNNYNSLPLDSEFKLTLNSSNNIEYENEDLDKFNNFSYYNNSIKLNINKEFKINFSFDLELFDLNRPVKIMLLDLSIKKLIKKYVMKFFYYKIILKNYLLTLNDYIKKRLRRVNSKSQKDIQINIHDKFKIKTYNIIN